MFVSLGSPDDSSGRFVGPLFVDSKIRQAISSCGMLGNNPESIDALRNEGRRLIEIALQDLDPRRTRSFDRESFQDYLGVDDTDEEFDPRRMGEFAFKSTVAACLWFLPEDRRDIPQLRVELNRLLERALRDLEEDRKHFGLE